MIVCFRGERRFRRSRVSGSDVHADIGYDKAYYGGKYANTKQIIESQVGPASASRLMTELPS